MRTSIRSQREHFNDRSGELAVDARGRGRVEQLWHIGNSRRLFDPRTAWRDTSRSPGAVAVSAATGSLSRGWAPAGSSMPRQKSAEPGPGEASPKRSGQQCRLRTVLGTISQPQWRNLQAHFLDHPRTPSTRRGPSPGSGRLVRKPNLELGGATTALADNDSTVFESLARLHLAKVTPTSRQLSDPIRPCSRTRPISCTLRTTNATTTVPSSAAPPHHHFLANIGRGFLGVLEGCAVTRGRTRLYEFPAAVHSRRARTFAVSVEPAG